MLFDHISDCLKDAAIMPILAKKPSTFQNIELLEKICTITADRDLKL